MKKNINRIILFLLGLNAISIYFWNPQLNFQWEFYFCRDYTPFDIFLIPNFAVRDISYKECELCNFTVRNQLQDSCNRDVLIGTAVRHISNEHFFSRSIRTAHSKCHIVIICDQKAISDLPKKRYEAAVKCGVQFIVVPLKEWNGDYFAYASVGYYYVLAFLLRNRGKFKRVVYQDLFDSVFQGDPFTKDLITSYNEIHVTTEYFKGNNEYMINYYKRANITQPEFYKEKWFKNSSHFGAYEETMLKFMLIFVSVNDFKMGWNDQITANYLEFSGILRKNNLFYSDDKKIERFVNLISSQPIEGSFGNIHAIFSKEEYAVALHHIWSRPNILINISQYCMIHETNKTLAKDYFGKCNEKCINQIWERYNTN